LTAGLPGSRRGHRHSQGGEPAWRLTEFTEQKALGGISYPATKDQLIERARANNAGTDVLAVLEDVPDGEYGGPNEISKAGEVEKPHYDHWWP
jgi:hypothetical protein